MSYGIKANVREPHRFLRIGALCWLVGTPKLDRLRVRGLSHGGRVVVAWVKPGLLTNYRVGRTSSVENAPYRFDTKAAAQEWADHYAAASLTL